MRTHLRRNAVAYLALFVALGGTSYAAVQLPKNSVTAKQIKTSAVRSAEVKNGSLKAKDFKAGQLPDGPAGPAGPVGPMYGDQGPNDIDTTPVAPKILLNSGQVHLTLPAAGRLFVYGHAGLLVSCSTLSPVAALYLDGSPVPGTGRVVGATATPVDFAGLSGPVAAGNHVVQVGVGCQLASATMSGVSDSGNEVGGILVGG
jgi:hypothetical protein